MRNVRLNRNRGLAMRSFRTRQSAAIIWGMIPLAVWAGLPRTACVCANGQIKLVCRHVATSHMPDDHESDRHSCCVDTHEVAAEADSDHEADCCSSGSCCHGAAQGEPGIGSKACCKPILAVPSLAPESTTVTCDQALAVVSLVDDIGALYRPAFSRDVAEVDTGPPLDRVILFRSLLI